MASFSELANLSADEVAKVEDSKEARPAMRPHSGRNCYADLRDLRDLHYTMTSASPLRSHTSTPPSPAQPVRRAV